LKSKLICYKFYSCLRLLNAGSGYYLFQKQAFLATKRLARRLGQKMPYPHSSKACNYASRACTASSGKTEWRWSCWWVMGWASVAEAIWKNGALGLGDFCPFQA
jgi:hypothetical protein